MAASHDDLRDELLALERRLLDPAARAAAAAELLADDYVEHGRSGTEYGRAEALAAVAAPASAAAPEIADPAVRSLAPDVALVTYRSIDPGRGPARRVSVWVRRAGRWQVVFHQGTAAGPALPP